MGCTRGIKDDSYDFFDNINKYIKHSDEVELDEEQLNSYDNCDSFSSAYTNSNTVIGKNICEKFIKLCKVLPDLKNIKKNDSNYRNDWNFLSYWLNFKLGKSKLKGTICPKKFYDGMEHHSTETLLPLLSSSNLIYNINEEDLSRMEVLYILHENYSKLYTILNVNASPEPKTLLEPSSACSNYYKSARYMCNAKYNKYCEKLEKFKTQYDELFITAKRKGDQFANNFKKLTEDDNNIISTALIGSVVGLIPLLGILYKFIPIGQIFNSQKRKLSKGHSNNIDEIIKTSLLNYENDQLNLKQEKYNIEYHRATIM